MNDLLIRRATAADVPGIVALPAHDPLGVSRETPDDLSPYYTAYERLAADPGRHQIVAESGGRTVGILQLTVIPGLSRRGATRALIEAVRVDGSERGAGIGTRLMEWAIEESRVLGCALVQLTSDASREDAHRFYERLGFTASHIGFKLTL